MGADIDRHSVRPRPRARPGCFRTSFDFEDENEDDDEHDLNTLLRGGHGGRSGYINLGMPQITVHYKCWNMRKKKGIG